MKGLLAWILFLSFLSGIVPQQDTEKILHETEAGSAEIWIDMSQNMVYLDEASRVMVNVEYADTVSGDIDLVNDLGYTITTVLNDGSGEAQVVVELYETEARRAYLTGVCGEEKSEPEYYRVQPRITEEMGERLDSVLDGMLECLETADITDPDSPEVHALVCEYLAANPYVESYGENNGAIIFQTIDGLMGFYGFHAPDEMVFSGIEDPLFLPAEQAFARYEENALQGDEVIKSGVPVTNEKILFISPQDGDRTIDWGRSAFDPRLRMLANDTEAEYENVTGAAAVERLREGAFTDCGLLVFMAHGGQLLTDHGFVLTMGLGTLTHDQKKEMRDLTWAKKKAISLTDQHEKTTDPNQEEYFYYINDETAHILYGLSINSDYKFEYHAVATRSFMEYVLEDKKFDNTIAYFVVCYAASDPGMRELLLESGASAFIGTMDPLKVYTSFIAVEQICDMSREMEGGIYTTLEEAVDRVYEMPDDELIRDLYRSLTAVNGTTRTEEEYFADIYSEYTEEQMRNPLLLYARESECSDRVWLSDGTIRGRVTDEDGTGMAGAQVRFYRWLDHTFEQAPDNEFTLKTDEEGRYIAEDLPYGQYIIKAEKNGSQNYVHAELKGEECEAQDIILEPMQIIVTTDVENYADKNMTSQLVMPIVHIPNAPEAAERINARLNEIYVRAHERVKSGSQYLVEGDDARNSYDLNVSDMFSSGSLLFITFSEYEYVSGAAHGMGWATSLVFDAATGEEVSMSHLLSEDQEAADRLTAMIAERLSVENVREMYYSAGEVADEVVSGGYGEVSLLEEGMRVYFTAGSIAPYYVGPAGFIIPYEQLRGVLPDQYLPQPLKGDGSANVIFSETMGDFGTEGACVLKAEGIVQQVMVGEIDGDYHHGQRFYANFMKDQSASLPDVGDAAYFVEYNSGNQKIELTVE